MVSSYLQNKLVKLSRANIHLCDSAKKHFTFVLDGNKIVSFGWNRTWRSHPLAKKYNYRFSCQHSELHAITNLQSRLSHIRQLTFINVRLYKNGELAMSRPCPICQRLLEEFGVRRVYYSTKNGFLML